MDFLSAFTSMLNRATQGLPDTIRSSDDIDAVHRMLEQRVRDGGKNVEPVDRQIEAVKHFLQTGHIETLRDARRVAFGLVVRHTAGRPCLMEEKGFFGEALHEIDRWKHQSSPRQYGKCYQGLVRSYFDYDCRGRPEIGRVNWRELRDYLNRNADQIRSQGVNPDWVTCASSNAALFGEEPCAAYGRDLLNGKQDYVNEIRRLLGISDKSWFTEELILAHLRAATDLEHPEFQASIESLLPLLRSNKILQSVGLRILLDRYARIPLQPEHQALKEFAVHCWGNPWLPSNKDSWEGVTEKARQMVTDWLSREFIKLFFTKLTQDGVSDERRVDFWSKYVSSFDSMHFALGGRARDPGQVDFVELRQKLHGLTVELLDPNPNNNAFIMRMGDLLAVEFSGVSNALYAYNTRTRMPFDLSRPVTNPVDGRNSLKRTSHILKLSHQDGILGFDSWEDRFEHEFRTKFGIHQDSAWENPSTVTPMRNDAPAKPAAPIDRTVASPWRAPLENRPVQPLQTSPASSAPSPKAAIAPQVTTPSALRERTSSGSAPASHPTDFPRNLPFTMDNLSEFSLRTGFSVQNRSYKGGALWVSAPYHINNIREVLGNWGFKYTAGKGWWKKVE